MKFCIDLCSDLNLTKSSPPHPQISDSKLPPTRAEALARPLTVAERTHFAALATKPDAQIDFSDQPEITAVIITAGHAQTTGHGGARSGAGPKSLGKLRKTVKLSPAAIRRFQAYAKRKPLPDFSAALQAASGTL